MRADQQQVHGTGDPEPVPVLRCDDVSVAYGPILAVAGVSVAVAAGEALALLGASGSGKSTLLNTIAGLVHPSDGQIWLNGRCVADAGRDVPPERRDIGLVFQNGALWPHLSVLETVAYPLRRAGRSRREAQRAATRLLDQLGVAQLAARRPAELSGGEQQRVGLARALARNAGLYLLDEPTAHLDTQLRQAFQELVAAEQQRRRASVVFATHDPAEALALADRVALMDRGRIIQIGSPQHVYAEPASVVAAALTGPYSVLDRQALTVEAGRLRVGLPDGAGEIVSGQLASGGSSMLLVRPDWVYEGGCYDGVIAAVAFRGTHTDCRIDSAVGSLLMSLSGAPSYRVGMPLRWGLSRVWPLPALADMAGLPRDQKGPQPSAVIAAG